MAERNANVSRKDALNSIHCRRRRRRRRDWPSVNSVSHWPVSLCANVSAQILSWLSSRHWRLIKALIRVWVNELCWRHDPPYLDSTFRSISAFNAADSVDSNRIGGEFLWKILCIPFSWSSKSFDSSHLLLSTYRKVENKLAKQSNRFIAIVLLLGIFNLMGIKYQNSAG